MCVRVCVCVCVCVCGCCVVVYAFAVRNKLEAHEWHYAAFVNILRKSLIICSLGVYVFALMRVCVSYQFYYV